MNDDHDDRTYWDKERAREESERRGDPLCTLCGQPIEGDVAKDDEGSPYDTDCYDYLWEKCRD